MVPLGGGFSDLRALSAESSDHVRVTARGIEFDLTLDRGVDGFDWEADSGCNRFELLVDGASRPDRVRLGGTATPAETMPFERCR